MECRKAAENFSRRCHGNSGSDISFHGQPKPIKTSNIQTLSMAALASVRIFAAPGSDQQNLSGCCGGALSLGASSGALFVELCSLFRRLSVVPARPLYHSASRGNRCAFLAASEGRGQFASNANLNLLGWSIHLLHGLSWRTFPAETGTDPPHDVLSPDCFGRSLGGFVCGGDCAVHFNHILLIALRAVAVRAVAHFYTQPRKECFRHRTMALARMCLNPMRDGWT
jgi:hypothetical protein